MQLQALPAAAIFALCLGVLFTETVEGAKWTSDSLGELVLKSVSLLAGQKYVPEDSTPAKYKEFALNDTSNDEIIDSTVQEIILRSGYNCENYQVTSKDGYITTLVRLVNPLADRAKLKQPPVALFHGGIVDYKLWIAPSAIQHHPGKYPRSPEDGPMTSYNRSLPFTLANNGYDVWLIGTRGANLENQGHVKIENPGDIFGFEQLGKLPKSHSNSTKNSFINSNKNATTTTVDDGHRNLAQKLRYWDYSMDEIAKNEMPLQIDKVLEVTGAKKVNLIVMSFSSTLAVMMLAEQPQYAHKLHSTVVLAPIINNRGTNRFVRFAEQIARLLPSKLGTLLITELALPAIRAIVKLTSARSRQLRYTIYKAISLVAAGPSARYLTLLEPAVFANTFLPASFKEIKHFSQLISAGRLQKYDYGPIENQKRYGSLTPAKYDVSNIDLGTWLLVSCGQDVLAPPASAQQYVRLSRTPPVEHIQVKYYNHLDTFAAFDTDTAVYLPILRFLDQQLDRSSTTTTTADNGPQGNEIELSATQHGLLGLRALEKQAATAEAAAASLGDEKSKVPIKVPLDSPDMRTILSGHAQRNLISNAGGRALSNQQLLDW